MSPDPADELHIWRASLVPGGATLAELRSLLSADELQRATRFVFARDRDRFVAARGHLRCILSRYLDIAPQRLRFVYGPHGKPALERSAGVGIEFNLSHSGELALVAITRDRRVGVDIELLRATLDYTPLLRDLFAPREQQAFAGLPADEGRLRFFRGWVCKEAYIKACGEGLAHPPAAVEVEFPAHAPAVLRLPASATTPWSLYLLAPDQDYAAAAVAEGPPLAVRLFDHSCDPQTAPRTSPSPGSH